jgi:hypothetical protein
MNQATGRNHHGRGERVPSWLRHGWQEVYRGKATIVTVILFTMGLLLIFWSTTIEDDTWHHVVRDFGLAALIAGTLGSIYEYLLREDLEESVEDRLQGLLEESTKFRRAGLITIHDDLREDLLNKKFAEAKAKKEKGNVRILVTRTANDRVVNKYIPEAVREGCKVQILMLSPQSPQVAYRAHHLGNRTEDELRQQIMSELTHLIDACTKRPGSQGPCDITIKVYDAPPIFHMYDFGDIKLIGMCWRLTHSAWGPQFEIQEGTPLANLANSHFDDLWDDERPFKDGGVTQYAATLLNRKAKDLGF